MVYLIVNLCLQSQPSFDEEKYTSLVFKQSHSIDENIHKGAQNNVSDIEDAIPDYQMQKKAMEKALDKSKSVCCHIQYISTRNCL